MKIFYYTACFVICCLAAGNTFAQKRIVADLSKEKGILHRDFNECVGAGRANEGLRADWQRQLRVVKDQLGFRYIRMHGLLTDDMGVYSEDKNGNAVYNWQYIDELYDFLLSIQVRPFVELGFMPNALASGKQTIFWWRGNVTPPKDYTKWHDLIKALTAHWTERYGATEVEKWYFEVWNEPNLKGGFWTGSQDEYFKLYDYAASAVKEVNAAYRVGGPATAGSGWVPEFIQHCYQQKIPVDFVSTHTYGVDQGFLDENGNTGTVLSKNDSSVYGEIIQIRKEIEKSPLPKLELHYTEWSASYTPADPIHDSYHEAAYVLDKIARTQHAANSMSYWTFTDIFEEPGPRFTPFHGGFGMVNYQDIKKPVFFAYKYLNQLFDTELLSNDSAAIVTKDAKGNVRVLCWNFTRTLPDSINNQQYFIKDLPPKQLPDAMLSLSHLAQGSYTLSVFKTGYRSNDAHTAYVDMGRPNQLTKQQVNQLKQVASDAVVINKNIVVSSEGTLNYKLPMRENDVYFIELKKK